MENKRIYSLKKSSDFLFLSKNGIKLKPSKWLTVYYVNSEDGKTSFGITASRKTGNSVTRNKLKRWVRNCARSSEMPKSFFGKKAVFVFRAQSEGFFSSMEFKEFKNVFYNLQFT